MSYETEQEKHREHIIMERVSEVEIEVVRYKAIVLEAILGLKGLNTEGWSPNKHYDVANIIDILSEARPDDLAVISKRFEKNLRDKLASMGRV